MTTHEIMSSIKESCESTGCAHCERSTCAYCDELIDFQNHLEEGKFNNKTANYKKALLENRYDYSSRFDSAL